MRYFRTFPLSLLFTISIFTTAVFSCKQGKKTKERQAATADTTITPQNAVSTLFIDSTDLHTFLSKAGLTADDSLQITNFYKQRNYQFAWFDTSGLAENATSFISLFHNFRSNNKDSSLYDKKLDAAIDNITTDSAYLGDNKKVMLSTELGLTQKFFEYSEKAYAGNTKVNLEDLGWFIPRKKINITAFLDSVVKNKGQKINEYEPVHPMFTPLHNYLVKYSEIEKNGGWPVITFDKKMYKEGDNAPAIGLIKKRLQMVGDLDASDSGNIYTAATKQAVLGFQHRYGLKEDGIANTSTLNEMNKPVSERIKQLAVNIERIKWVPTPGSGRYIVANIPAFKLYVYDSGRLQWDMKVVVGSEANSTVVFSDELETIAFSPYWNIPYSIVKKEMTGKNAAYFAKRNMEVVGKYSDGRPMVRQKPGPTNSLGLVKFLFPNSYSIYFHDTPAKGLFNQTNRAASHGCIRLAEPVKMAQYLLDYDPNWTLDSINKSMHLDKEKQVKLAKKVPVFIGYFTAWVDSAGKLNFRDDIYGHDKVMEDKLFASK